MRRQSVLLMQYGIWVKIGLGCLIFICLGGLNAITCFREMNAQSDLRDRLNQNKTLDDYARPPAYGCHEFDDWKERKESAQKEINVILEQAKAKDDNYSLVDYFRDFDKLMVLEDRFHFYLTSSALIFDYPIHQLALLRDANPHREVNKSFTPEQVAYMDGVRTKIEHRSGEYFSRQPPSSSYVILVCVVNWLWPKYLMLTLFWFLVYIIRFEERTKAMEKLPKHHHDGNYFYEAEEPFPGQLSLKDELIICPWRFLSRVLLWPFYFRAYPFFENTAEGRRYLQAKARLLQNKPFGYQLNFGEDLWVRREARKPVAEFEKMLKQLSEIEVPQLVKKSLFTAYLSLIFGILLQPAIVLAASHSKKVDTHFYGQNPIVLVEHQNDSDYQIRDGTSTPNQQHDQTANNWLTAEVQPLLSVPNGLMQRLADLILLKPKEVFAEIVHVHISGLLAARC
jgi:hypothetical protein